MAFLRGLGRGFGLDWRGIYFRRNYNRLEEVVTECRRWIPSIFPSARFTQRPPTWEFVDGEILKFRYLDRPAQYDEYHGHQYTLVLFDEITEWATVEVLDKMKGNLRSARPGVRPILRAATNAWGLGFGCVKRYFRIYRHTGMTG